MRPLGDRQVSARGARSCHSGCIDRGPAPADRTSAGAGSLPRLAALSALALLVLALAVHPAGAMPWGVWLPGPGASGDWHWMPPVATLGDLPADPDGSVRMVLAEAALHCRLAGAWAACSAGGGGTDDQTAVEVPITDAGGYFAAAEVESALQEIGPTMTDARTPTAHAATHGAGGGDPVSITEAQVSDLAHIPDDQVASEVPYTPSTPGDWTDPDPTEVGAALDTLAGRELAASFGALTGGTNTTAPMVVGAGSTLRVDGGGGVIGASEIDADGDGTAEIDVDGSVLVARTGNFKVELNASDYIQFISGGTNADIRLGSGSGGLMNLLTESASAGIRFSPNGNTKALECDDGDCEVSYTLGLSPSTATCLDDGAGTAPSPTITPTTSLIELTNSDPDGCLPVLADAGVGSGQILHVVVLGNAGGTIDFADTPGVQETGAGCSLSLHGAADFVRTSDGRWITRNCRPSN